MPVVTAYRSELAAGSGRYSVEWWEWSFAPPGAPVAIVAPPLSRLVTRRVCAADGEWRDAGRLAVPWDAWGLDPETCVWLAGRGERGFRPATEEDMRKRRADDGPGLFPEEAPAVGAYGPASRRRGGAEMVDVSSGHVAVGPAPGPDRERIRSEVAAIAAEVIGPLAGAVRRALEELDAGRPATARAILECALEDAGGGRAA